MFATDTNEGPNPVGIYAAKILKGAGPGNLPIQQASKHSNYQSEDRNDAHITVPHRC